MKRCLPMLLIGLGALLPEMAAAAAAAAPVASTAAAD